MQGAKNAADDGGEHRRGHQAAVIGFAARVVDHHHRGHPRVGGRGDAGEQADVAVVGVAVGGDLVHGAGFAGHLVTGNLRAAGGALDADHGFQHAYDGLGAGRRDHLLALGRLVHLEQGQRHPAAVVGEDRVGLGQLQRGGADAVAVGQRGALHVPPTGAQRQHAVALAGVVDAGALAEAEALQVAGQHHGVHGQRQLADAHVGALGEHGGDVDNAVIAVVTDGLAAHAQIARVGVDRRGGRDQALLHGGGDGERLDRGARLEQVGDRPVAQAGGVQVAPVVGVVGGLVDHRQHFAGLDVEHHGGAAPGLEATGGGQQLFVGQVLQAQVQAQGDVLAGRRRFQHFDVLDHAAEQVANHFLAARLAGQLLFEGQFHAFLAALVDVGETDQMAGHFAGRVVAAVFGERVDAGHLFGEHGLCLFRRQAAGQVDEFLALVAVDPAGEGAAVDDRVVAQARPLLLVLQGFAGVGPQGGDRGAHRQRPAGAVLDHAAMGGHRLHPQVADIALVGQEVVLYHLQLHRAPHQNTGTARPEHQHETPAQGAVGLARRRLSGGFARCLGCGSTGAFHGRINTRSSVFGNFMPSSSRARRSTRA